jgi:uncharacterized protein YecE (DUF72 family)
MARFWIGTSGWQYRDWKERFYPKDVPQKQWLAYYCERFRTVEINNSFYMQPSEKSWEHWRETAPDGFRFAVKAHRYLTHRKRLKNSADSLERVIKSARLLKSRLGPVLFQLPPYFKRNEENAERLESFLDMLPRDLLCSLEFRDGSWFGEETLAQLRRHRSAFCSYDMTGVDVPLVPTAGFAYVRFHGPGARYRGNYSDRMLESWARRLRRLVSEVDDVYAYFNNDALGHAVNNAMTLRRMLGDAVSEPGSRGGLGWASGRSLAARRVPRTSRYSTMKSPVITDGCTSQW